MPGTHPPPDRSQSAGEPARPSMSIGLGEYSLSRGPVGLNRFSIDNQRASMDYASLARSPTSGPPHPPRPNKPPPTPPTPPRPVVAPELHGAAFDRFFHDPSTGESSYVLPRHQLDAWIDSILEAAPRQPPPLPSRGERPRSRGRHVPADLPSATGAEPDLGAVERADEELDGPGSGGGAGGSDEMWVAKLHVDTGQVYYQHRVYTPSYRTWTDGHLGQASSDDTFVPRPHNLVNLANPSSALASLALSPLTLPRPSISLPGPPQSWFDPLANHSTATTTNPSASGIRGSIDASANHLHLDGSEGRGSDAVDRVSEIWGTAWADWGQTREVRERESVREVTNSVEK